MSMPTSYWGPDTFLGNPSFMYGTPVRKGNTARVRKLLLDKVAYPAGGWELTFADVCLQYVYSACMLMGKDPMNCDIPCTGAVVPCLVIDATGKATLKLYVNGAEASVGWAGPVGSYLWISFTGVA